MTDGPVEWLYWHLNEVEASSADAGVLRLAVATRKVLAMHSGYHECVSEEDNCVWVTEPACETMKTLADGWGWPG